MKVEVSTSIFAARRLSLGEKWALCQGLQDAKAYRAGAGAGVAAVGAGAVDVTTTGYFAHAARPTSEAISASTSGCFLAWPEVPAKGRKENA